MARICHVLSVDGQGWTAVAELARLQRGVVHYRQLRALGISAGTIARLCRQGHLHRILPLVYAVGHAALPVHGAEVAALLRAGDDAVLSHSAAAAVWGLTAPRSPLHVTLCRHIRDLPTVRAYRVASLDVRDVCLRHGLPVTAPARTLIDHAATVSADEFAGALAEARVNRLVTDTQLEAAMARAPLRTGAARLRATLDDPTGTGRQPTRNAAERRLLALIAQAGLPTPAANARVSGFEVDLLWAAEKVIVELDGWGAHGHQRAFERDRRRDQVLHAAGYQVIRVTWRQLTRDEMGLIVRIAQTLARAAP